jgi:hypothetical protein
MISDPRVVRNRGFCCSRQVKYLILVIRKWGYSSVNCQLKLPLVSVLPSGLPLTVNQKAGVMPRLFRSVSFRLNSRLVHRNVFRTVPLLHRYR